MAAAPYFQDLPLDILVNILSDVTPRDVLSVREVSIASTLFDS